MAAPPPIHLIAGPTASGKSALALRLAGEIGGEIVGADSMQIYRDLAILTARPAAREMALAPHHLYGVADGAEAWSVGRWLGAAREVLADIAGRGRPAIVVGGTGLYLRALTVGLADMPAVPAAAREESQTLFDQLGEASFRRRLAAIDPAAESRIAPGDRQRLTRAHEVFVASAVSLSAWRAATRPVLAPASWRAVVLAPPRADLYGRCAARAAAMIEAGALDEVAALMARRLDPALPAMKALGVAPLAAHLAGEITLAEALAAVQRDTRRYAKRQLTWFRHQTPGWPRIEALDASAQWDQLRAVLVGSEPIP
ncbi:MAG: tRNA (adenosine(37)-N6)-dimethylallyltransferase MiaA [Caulobacteraceae bacterium]